MSTMRMPAADALCVHEQVSKHVHEHATNEIYRNSFHQSPEQPTGDVTATAVPQIAVS